MVALDLRSLPAGWPPPMRVHSVSIAATAALSIATREDHAAELMREALGTAAGAR